MLHVGGWTARVAPWRRPGAVAHLVPVPGQRPPSVAELREVLAELATLGYADVLTTALAAGEQEPYRATGFLVRQRLHLLEAGLHDLPRPAGGVRRVRRHDWPALVHVDHLAFDDFWRLDATGITEAVQATPSARLRAATSDGRLVGYAVTGRSGRSGYVQRLAVDPSAQGRGVGSNLLMDGLRWLRARGATSALVNTQVGNGRALALYERHGFRSTGPGLAVLGRPVPPP
jgi:ribosomal-protein-alanine N-acetyltransferase